MNKPRLPRPRLVCSLVRRWEAGFGPGSGQGRLASRHLESCPECREFFAEDPGFEQCLRRDAARLREQPSDPGLERRILRAVMQAKGAPAEKRGPREEISPVWGRALLASAGLAAALAFVFWSRPPETRPDAPAVVAKELSVSPEAPPPRLAATEPGGGWRSREAGPRFAWAEKNPLEREIESVRTDARAIVGFLALNFLPTKSRPETPPSQG